MRGAEEKVRETQEHYKHQAWECSVFKQHWTRLRRQLKLPSINSLSEIALGQSVDGKRTLKMPIRYRALALHSALWQERRKIENLQYDSIICLFNEMILVYEKRGEKVKGKPEAP